MSKHYIIISSIDWSTHWQMHHQLATSLVDAGNRVLFIENTGVRAPKLKDFGRIRERIRNWLKSEHGFRQTGDRLWLFFPLFLPFPYSRVANYLNVLFLSVPIKRWLTLLRFSDPVIISFIPTALSQELTHIINPSLSVYYCTNHMAGGSESSRPLRKWEDKFFSNTDITFTISAAITERAKPFSPVLYSFPPGVDIHKFERSGSNLISPVDIAHVQKPLIGYIGGISDVFDIALIVELAKSVPNATIVLIGPTYIDISALQSLPNILLLGERPHDLIPAYLNSFDVALVPYVVNEFTDSVYSCKLNEYLAMGVPVVSTDMAEFRIFDEQFPDVVLIAHGREDFVEKVKRALADPQIRSQQMIDKRIAVARENTWEKRFTGIMEVIDHHLFLKSQEVVPWRVSLAQYYKQSRIRWVVTTAVIVLLYLLVFATPLVWFAGDQLVVRDIPHKADALVVFSGNGEASYRNESYQRRALDAVRYYSKGYASHIFLSSGREQNLSEVAVIKLYLMEKGVAASAIHILERYPRSTGENVKLVKHELELQGVHSIIFLTSPYHSRRALLIWRKQAPDIAVLSPIVVDTPPSKPQWHANMKQIIVIAYEYAAIVYNWLQGWL
jgi:uncharacterized SAM-binding protein YcdF (DUF218 family)/glycosyltransferase involved in cell wall biosynthesis